MSVSIQQKHYYLPFVVYHVSHKSCMGQVTLSKEDFLFKPFTAIYYNCRECQRNTHFPEEHIIMI